MNFIHPSFKLNFFFVQIPVPSEQQGHHRQARRRPAQVLLQRGYLPYAGTPGLYSGVNLPENGYFCPTPFFKNDIFTPKYSENLPFFSFVHLFPLIFALFLIKSSFYFPANQYFIFFIKWKIYTPGMYSRVLSQLYRVVCPNSCHSKLCTFLCLWSIVFLIEKKVSKKVAFCSQIWIRFSRKRIRNTAFPNYWYLGDGYRAGGGGWAGQYHVRHHALRDQRLIVLNRVS